MRVCFRTEFVYKTYTQLSLFVFGKSHESNLGSIEKQWASSEHNGSLWDTESLIQKARPSLVLKSPILARLFVLVHLLHSLLDEHARSSLHRLLLNVR